MTNKFSNIAKKVSEKIYTIFGKSSGNMLLATSILGFTLSSGAQIAAILTNKEYTVSQKAFMVPQEVGELLMATLAIFIITKPIQKLASKMVKTGKISSSELIKYMEDNKILANRGKMGFDFEAEVKNIIKKIKSSDEYINSQNKSSLLDVHNQALGKYEACADSVSAIATTTAGVITTGVVVPMVRNRFGAYYQKQNMYFYNKIVSPKPNLYQSKI